MHLQPTHPERLCDPDGRPYFLWDVDMTLADYLRRLDDPDEVVRAYWIGVALRQAKPDDAIALLGPDRIVAAMPLLSLIVGLQSANLLGTASLLPGSELCAVPPARLDSELASLGQ